jgi:hypothetical protein
VVFRRLLVSGLEAGICGQAQAFIAARARASALDDRSPDVNGGEPQAVTVAEHVRRVLEQRQMRAGVLR